MRIRKGSIFSAHGGAFYASIASFALVLGKISPLFIRIALQYSMKTGQCEILQP